MEELILKLTEYLRSKNLGGYANLVYAYELLITSKEKAGRQRAFGDFKFIERKCQRCKHNENSTCIKVPLLIVISKLVGFFFSNEMKSIYSSAFANSSNLMKKIE